MTLLVQIKNCKTLSKRQRREAERNLRRIQFKPQVRVKVKYEAFTTLEDSFIFKHTPQGVKYWKHIDNALKTA